MTKNIKRTIEASYFEVYCDECKTLLYSLEIKEGERVLENGCNIATVRLTEDDYNIISRPSKRYMYKSCLCHGCSEKLFIKIKNFLGELGFLED